MALVSFLIPMTMNVVMYVFYDDVIQCKVLIPWIYSQRHTFPYISAMLGDGFKSYDNDKDGRTTEFAGCAVSYQQDEDIKHVLFMHHIIRPTSVPRASLPRLS